MLNAIMVAICEHGFNPSSVATRLTYLGAPEAVQAAIAAGLLGAGTVYLGAMEYSAQMLKEGFAQHGKNTDDLETLAAMVIKEWKGKPNGIPGLGHPIHKPVDPRTVKLFELAKELGFYGEHSRLMEKIHSMIEQEKKKPITLNAIGAIGAILSDMGFHYGIVKSFGVAARAVGLVAHITEEIELGRKNSIAQNLFDYIEHNTVYEERET
jgi:citrate synthase